MRTFVVGTRGSALALWQTREVSALLQQRGVHCAERIITTQGDTSQAERLVGKLEKGFFTQELEAALHAREIDWAVHSLKDLPTRLPTGLALGAVLQRAPAGDVLLVRPDALDKRQELLPLKAGARVGSSSLRREALLRHFAPQVVCTALRGNVPTRLQKLRDGLYDGIVLAEAGLARLQLSAEGLAAFALNPRRWPGAPGQGAVAVQCRAEDIEVKALLQHLHHPPTDQATGLERDFLRILEGGCSTPFGCYVDQGEATLGLDTAVKGWVSQHLKIPPTPAATWLTAQLETLPHSQEQTHEWIFRRL